MMQAYIVVNFPIILDGETWSIWVPTIARIDYCIRFVDFYLGLRLA